VERSHRRSDPLPASHFPPCCNIGRPLLPLIFAVPSILLNFLTATVCYPIRNNRKGAALGHHHHHAAAPAGYGMPEYGPVYAAPAYGYAPPAYGYPFAV